MSQHSSLLHVAFECNTLSEVYVCYCAVSSLSQILQILQKVAVDDGALNNGSVQREFHKATISM